MLTLTTQNLPRPLEPTLHENEGVINCFEQEFISGGVSCVRKGLCYKVAKKWRKEGKDITYLSLLNFLWKLDLPFPGHISYA